MKRPLALVFTLVVLGALGTGVPTGKRPLMIRAAKTFTEVGGTLELRPEPLVRGIWSSSDPAVLAPAPQPGSFVGRTPGIADVIFTGGRRTVRRTVAVRRDSREVVCRPFSGVTEHDHTVGAEVVADELFVKFHAWVSRSERDRTLAELGLTLEGENPDAGLLTVAFDAAPGGRALLMRRLLDDPRIVAVDVSVVARPR